jgi:hypothetical protein
VGRHLARPPAAGLAQGEYRLLPPCQTPSCGLRLQQPPRSFLSHRCSNMMCKCHPAVTAQHDACAAPLEPEAEVPSGAHPRRLRAVATAGHIPVAPV